MTADNHQGQDDMVCLPRTEFESLLDQATCRGARKALKEVGLADEKAANDIRTLRDLADSIKTMKRTFLQTAVRWYHSPTISWRWGTSTFYTAP